MENGKARAEGRSHTMLIFNILDVFQALKPSLFQGLQLH